MRVSPARLVVCSSLCAALSLARFAFAVGPCSLHAEHEEEERKCRLPSCLLITLAGLFAVVVCVCVCFSACLVRSRDRSFLPPPPPQPHNGFPRSMAGGSGLVGCAGVAVGPVPLETQSLKLELMFHSATDSSSRNIESPNQNTAHSSSLSHFYFLPSVATKLHQSLMLRKVSLGTAFYSSLLSLLLFSSLHLP